MEERGAETRSAFPFFTLSTVFYVFSARTYASHENTGVSGINGRSWGTQGLHIGSLRALPLMMEGLVWFLDNRVMRHPVQSFGPLQRSRSTFFSTSPSLGYLPSLWCVAKTAEHKFI